MLFKKKTNLNNKIIVMDLDDTIYNENSFFSNGLDQVSKYLSKYLNLFKSSSSLISGLFFGVISTICINLVSRLIFQFCMVNLK